MVKPTLEAHPVTTWDIICDLCKAKRPADPLDLKRGVRWVDNQWLCWTHYAQYMAQIDAEDTLP